jgi:SAM-dependent methyltransferase
MKIKETLNKIEKLYTDNLNNHGDSSKAVGWNTDKCQNMRFQKLSSVIDNIQESHSINDYGCGYGGHLQYLEKMNYKINHYNGYDISQPMLEQAKNNLSDSKYNIELFNVPKINTIADYTFVSGTFNVRFGSNDKSWEKFIKTTLNEINNYSTKGFSFNLLSTYVDYQDTNLFYGDPCYWFDYCKTNFSTKVSLLHDYPLYEWTIIVKKEY